MHISEYFSKKPTLFWSMIVAIVALGVYSYLVMPKLEDPEISIKQAVVMTPYPGASAHEVELEVTTILEEALQTMQNVQDIQSSSYENYSTITISLDMSVVEGEVQQRWDILRRKVKNAESKLPSGAMSPIVIDDFSDVYGMFYAITGDGYDYNELVKYANYIKRELQQVKGVKRITLFGTRDESIEIELSKESIARLGILPTQIMLAIDGHNKPVRVGSYQTGDSHMHLSVDGKLSSIEDIQNILIQTLDGNPVKLSDIAIVSRKYTEPQTNGMWINNQPAIAIALSAESNAVVPDLGKAVDARFDELQNNLPMGIEHQKVYFQPDKVTNSVNSFILNLIESIVIVILLLVLFMDWRSGLIIGSGLLLTVLASFPILLLMGTTLQRISLGAFIVAMGMLVDNAVVVMDGILVDKRRGFNPQQYLFRAAKDTAIPLLGATLIAVVSFMVVYLSKSTAGEYAGDLFIVFCVSLLVSWFLALTQIPVFAKYFLPKRISARDTDSMNTPLHRFLKKTTKLLLNHKAVTVCCAVLLLGASIFGFFHIKNMFFPDFEYEQLYIEYTLPSQTTADRTKADLQEITQKLLEYPEIQKVTTSQNQTPMRYCLVRAINSGGDNYGEFIVNFSNHRTANRMFNIIQKRLREDYPDAYIRVRKYNFSTTTTHRVEAMFKGPDPAILHQLSEQAQEIMRHSDEIDAYSVCDNWHSQGKNILAHYDPLMANAAGITRSDVANSLLAATDGYPVGLFTDNDKSLIINLVICNPDGSRIQDINDIPVWSLKPNLAIENNDIYQLVSGGKEVSELLDNAFSSTPLSQITNGLELGFNETCIQRYNGQRALKVQCEPTLESTPFAAKKSIIKQISSIPLPEGYSLEWLGESKLQGDAIASIMQPLPIVIIIILFILLFLFNDIRKLLLCLLCIPFVAIGIVPALLISGQPFTFMSLIGTIGLMGMIIKNVIVLIDEITKLSNSKEYTPYEAIITATVNRIRPVFLASGTTILGVIPLLFDSVYCSLAITIMAGLLVGTFVTLVFLPTLYALFFKIQKTTK